MLEKLFHTMSSYGRFMRLDHPTDVVHTSLEYIPRIPWKCSHLFLFFLSSIILKLGLNKKN
jgi:hypothetical protein